MTMTYRLITLLAATVAFLLASCSSTTPYSNTQVATNFIHRQSVTTTTNSIYPVKNSQTVALYSDSQLPSTPYRIIGIASVSKHNLIGMQRKDETINKMMQKLAASIGGDALINLSPNGENMQANVIAFQKILL